MQATIIFNAKAGKAQHIELEELKATLVELGYFPVHRATESEDDLDAALLGVDGLVVVVGGDGTIRSTALRLLGQRGVKLAILPAGTANNIYRSFGLELSWQEILHGLPTAREARIDVGRVRGPLGEQHFIEAFGCGAYADALAHYDPEQGKSVARALATLTDLLPSFQPYAWQFDLDGEDLSGDYLLLEVLNTGMTGPSLMLAPEADPTDGLLEVVTIAAEQRESFFQYVKHAREGTLPDLESVTVRRGKRLELVWTGFPVHVDGVAIHEVAEPEQMQEVQGISAELRTEREAVLAVDLLPRALTLLLAPAPGTDTA